jgi:hypothetical protein
MPPNAPRAEPSRAGPQALANRHTLEDFLVCARSDSGEVVGRVVI